MFFLPCSSPTGAWPVLIDDFVEFARSHIGTKSSRVWGTTDGRVHSLLSMPSRDYDAFQTLRTKMLCFFFFTSETLYKWCFVTCRGEKKGPSLLFVVDESKDFRMFYVRSSQLENHHCFPAVVVFEEHVDLLWNSIGNSWLLKGILHFNTDVHFLFLFFCVCVLWCVCTSSQFKALEFLNTVLFKNN